MVWTQFFGYVCTVTLKFEDMTLGQVYDKHLGHEQISVCFYPGPTWQLEVMTKTRIFRICTLWP